MREAADTDASGLDRQKDSSSPAAAELASRFAATRQIVASLALIFRVKALQIVPSRAQSAYRHILDSPFNWPIPSHSVSAHMLDKLVVS
jgi:hypothetical protein